MIILDTNIVSEVWRPNASPAVLDWLGSQPSLSLYLCTPVLAELRYGMERLAPGRRKDILIAAIDHIENEGYRDRILPLDAAAAAEFGRLMVKRDRAGRRMETMDGLIAAIAAVNGAPLATRDIRDFADLGLQVINPFDAKPKA
jgi:predicted nucleic acid-binding protein